MVKEKLTARQESVFNYIKDYISKHGSSPTIREIGAKLNMSSTNGVRQHIAALIKKGYLIKHNLIARGLELVDKPPTNIGVIPIVGSVPAGNPIDAIQNIEGEIAFDESFLPKGDSFSLKVTGNSMINAGIFDGDIVLVKKQKTANRGDIVVAIIGDEATVKRYFPEDKRIVLQPENDDFEPIVVDKNSPEFIIAGKVVSLIRKL